MNAIQIILLLGIILVVLYLYSNIVPCDQKNKTNNNNQQETNNNKGQETNNNQQENNEQTEGGNNRGQENFANGVELNPELKYIVDQRTEMLKDHTIESMKLTKLIEDYKGQIKHVKDKLKMLLDEDEEEELLYNTNGLLSMNG